MAGLCAAKRSLALKLQSLCPWQAISSSGPCQSSHIILWPAKHLIPCCPSDDSVSERLRRWTRNPLGSARRGSNPLAVALASSSGEVASVATATKGIALCCTASHIPLYPCNIHIALRIKSPYRLVVRTSRCGRDNPGSTPGEDMIVLSAHTHVCNTQ